MRDRRSLLRGLAALPLAAVPAIAATEAKDSPDRLVTVEQMATLPFEAWEHEPGEWTPPSREEWAADENPYLVSVRIAWQTLHKHRDEVITLANGMWNRTDGDGEILFKTVIEHMQSAQAYFGRYQEVLRLAELRLMCGLAASEGGDA